MFSRPYSSTSHAVEASSHSCCWSGVASAHHSGLAVRRTSSATTEFFRRRLLPSSSTASRAGTRAATSAAGSSPPIRIRFKRDLSRSAFGVFASRVIWRDDAVTVPRFLCLECR